MMEQTGTEALYREFTEYLSKNNASDWGIRLPQIAVAGGTSTGKSSLLSSISGIEFPSSSALTTRCPTRVRLVRCPEKDVYVSISWSTETKMMHNDIAAWEKRGLIAVNEIKSIIEEAQRHIIEVTRKEVATDCIDITLFGPEYVDLTLTDLPGFVLSTADSESKSLSQEIDNMIDSYLQNDRCIILAVVPANANFRNSQILAKAQRVDPDMKRTIPVITKPDQLTSSAERASALDLLNNKYMSFTLGWNIVKCRGQDDVDNGMTLQEAANQEAGWFRTTSPWCTANPSLLGTSNLREKLAQIQLQLLNDCVPIIIGEIAKRKRDANDVLDQLDRDDLSDDLRRSIFEDAFRKVRKLFADMLTGNDHVKDEDGYTSRARLHEKEKEFRDEVLQSELSNLDRIKVDMEVSVILDDGKEYNAKVLSVNTDTAMAILNPTILNDKFYTSTTCNLSGSYDVGDVIHLADSGFAVALTAISGGISHKETVGRLKEFPFSDIRRSYKWLEKRIEQNRNDDPPYMPSPKLFRKLVREMVEEQWVPLANDLLKEFREFMQRAVDSCFSEFLPRFPDLQSEVMSRINGIVAEMSDESDRAVRSLLVCEGDTFTQNPTICDMIATKRNSNLRRKIIKMLSSAEKSLVPTFIPLAEAIFRRAERLSIDSHCAQDMATCIEAYGKVACKRLIDNMPMMARQRFDRTVSKLLVNGRHIYCIVFVNMTQYKSCMWQVERLQSFHITSDLLSELMVESTDIKRKRQEAKVMLENMESSERVLHTLSKKTKRSL